MLEPSDILGTPLLIRSPEELGGRDVSALLWAYSPGALREHGVDAHLIHRDGTGLPIARYSLWWRKTPGHLGHRVGFIGHYAVNGSAAADEALDHACQQLARGGCSLAIGPMDGSTWRKYRLVTRPGPRPPFFLEPENPPDWPQDWARAGFEPMAEYESRVVGDLGYEDLKGGAAGARLQAMGVGLRSIDLGRFDEELGALYPLLVTSFRGGFLYTPISEKSFIEDCRRLRPFLRPELITIAEHLGTPVGLLFGIPDLKQAERGERVDTSIIKTLVISPLREYAGLGSYLAAEHHRRCRDLGFQRVIHALMHQSSKSRNISARYGPILRRYTLFAKAL